MSMLSSRYPRPPFWSREATSVMSLRRYLSSSVYPSQVLRPSLALRVRWMEWRISWYLKRGEGQLGVQLHIYSITATAATTIPSALDGRLCVALLEQLPFLSLFFIAHTFCNYFGGFAFNVFNPLAVQDWTVSCLLKRLAFSREYRHLFCIFAFSSLSLTP